MIIDDWLSETTTTAAGASSLLDFVTVVMHDMALSDHLQGAAMLMNNQERAHILQALESLSGWVNGRDLAEFTACSVAQAEANARGAGETRDGRPLTEREREFIDT